MVKKVIAAKVRKAELEAQKAAEEAAKVVEPEPEPEPVPSGQE
jgi:hypothetical protein